MNATCVLENKNQAVDRTAYIWKPVPYFRLRKDSDFPEWLQSHTQSGDNAIIVDAKISARIKIR